MMGAKLQKDGVMHSLGVRYIDLINHKIHEKGPKNTVKDAALQRSLLQRGVQPLSICWLFRQKGQRAVFFGGKKFRFQGMSAKLGDTKLLLCNCWFLWCFRNCVFESFPHENIFRNYLVGPLSTTSLSVSLYLVKCSFTKFYKNNFGCLPLLVCVLIENLTRTSLKSRQGFSSPIMLNTAMSFNMNIHLFIFGSTWKCRNH